MHLTRLLLDPRSAQARRDLADPYEMHRTLARVFAKDDRHAPPRFLWRFESSGAWSDPVVLVQSAHAADWSRLDSVLGYLQRPADTKVVSMERLLQPAARYRFRLLANPTVTRDGKRHGLVTEDTQLGWLARQGERCGFRVDAALVTSSDVLNSSKGGSRISLQRTCFEGVLQLLDVDKMAVVLQDGIGPGKAFGCGLLSLGALKLSTSA